MTKIVFVATAGVATIVASLITPNSNRAHGEDLDAAHLEIIGDGAVFYDTESISHGQIVPDGIIVSNDLHLHMLSPDDFFKEIHMTDDFMKERETFPLDLSRPIIRDQVLEKKPKYLIKKIIH